MAGVYNLCCTRILGQIILDADVERLYSECHSEQPTERLSQAQKIVAEAENPDVTQVRLRSGESNERERLKSLLESGSDDLEKGDMDLMSKQLDEIKNINQNLTAEHPLERETARWSLIETGIPRRKIPKSKPGTLQPELTLPAGQATILAGKSPTG